MSENNAAVKPQKKGFFASLKKVKHIEIYLAVLIGAVIFLIYFSSVGGSRAGKGDADAGELDYAAAQKAQLCSLLGKVKGAGDVEVMIRFECSPEKIIAYTTTASNTGTGTQSSSVPQIISQSGVQKPLVLKEVYPKALSVLVVASGASSARVRIEIIAAVSAHYGIDPANVIVLAGK
ncbi:MAG: hypothetical protein FWE62_00590 [Firmicutes bacterium]|nr:hypothetical protein [Bacillota bacterium]